MKILVCYEIPFAINCNNLAVTGQAYVTVVSISQDTLEAVSRSLTEEARRGCESKGGATAGWGEMVFRSVTKLDG